MSMPKLHLGLPRGRGFDAGLQMSTVQCCGKWYCNDNPNQQSNGFSGSDLAKCTTAAENGGTESCRYQGGLNGSVTVTSGQCTYG